MDNTSNRTFVCSVLYLDIVEYSRRSVTEQMKLKERFNALLIQALQQVAVSDRIVLDTGDGAAVCFLGSPEVAMFVAMDMRDDIAAESPDEIPVLEVRMGANLGPIRLIKDINGQTNIIGDGINVAQRVMSFADPGTVLVSRSFFEVVSRLSDDYANILRYEGSRTDKHVREHEVYAVGQSVPHKPAEAPLPAGALAVGDTALASDAVALPATQIKVKSGSGKKLLIGSVLLALATVGVAVMLRMEHGSGNAESGGEPQPVVAPEHPQEKTSQEASPKAVQTEATVLLRIVPWGEVYVDGQKRGISPPLKSLSLIPGMHTVEIRNASFPAHLEKVDLKPGTRVTIKHKF